jgi:hypothetical protein
MGSEIVAIVTSYPSLESQAVAADHRVRDTRGRTSKTTERLETDVRVDPPLAVSAPAALHPPDLHAPPPRIAEHLQRALHTLAAGGRLVKWFQRWWKRV